MYVCVLYIYWGVGGGGGGGVLNREGSLMFVSNSTALISSI